MKKYDEELRKCVEVDKKKDKSGGGDNPDNPEPDNPEPEPTPE